MKTGMQIFLSSSYEGTFSVTYIAFFKFTMKFINYVFLSKLSNGFLPNLIYLFNFDALWKTALISNLINKLFMFSEISSWYGIKTIGFCLVLALISNFYYLIFIFDMDFINSLFNIFTDKFKSKFSLRYQFVMIELSLFLISPMLTKFE